jgi:orotidine-5'-phosphate decarboxylase
VAGKVNQWNTNGNLGLVVGATYHEELKLLRNKYPDMPFLIPGVGKQGGDVEKTIRYGTNKKKEMAIINSSRGIIFAGKNENFADESRKEALSLKNEINKYR